MECLHCHTALPRWAIEPGRLYTGKQRKYDGPGTGPVRPPDQRDAGPVPVFAFAGCVCLGKESMAVPTRDPPRHWARSCLRWGCAPCPTAPGVINHHPERAGLQSWQSGGERSASTPILSPAVCAVIPRCSRRGEPRLERALVQSWQNSAEKTGCVCLGKEKNDGPGRLYAERQRKYGRPATGPKKV